MKKIKETKLLNKIYTAKTGLTASRMLESLLKKYPEATPTITYIPKENAIFSIMDKFKMQNIFYNFTTTFSGIIV